MIFICYYSFLYKYQMGNKNEELYETIPHLLYIYVRTLFCVNKYIVPYI